MGEQTCTLILGYQPDDRVSLRACQVLARLRHPAMSVVWSLSGVKRKWRGHRQNDAIDPKRSSATHSRLHFGRPEPWKGRLAALLVSKDVLTKAQMSACGDKLKFSAQSAHYRL